MSSRVYGGMLNLFLPSLISLKAISALGCFHGSLARLTLARLVRNRLRACIVCPVLHRRRRCLDTSRFYITDADSVWSGGSVIGLAARIVIFTPSRSINRYRVAFSTDAPASRPIRSEEFDDQSTG